MAGGAETVAAGLASVGGLRALHSFGLDRLASVHALDPSAYASLRGSLDSLMHGLQVCIAVPAPEH